MKRARNFFIGFFLQVLFINGNWCKEENFTLFMRKHLWVASKPVIYKLWSPVSLLPELYLNIYSLNFHTGVVYHWEGTEKLILPIVLCKDMPIIANVFL